MNYVTLFIAEAMIAATIALIVYNVDKHGDTEVRRVYSRKYNDEGIKEMVEVETVVDRRLHIVALATVIFTFQLLLAVAVQEIVLDRRDVFTISDLEYEGECFAFLYPESVAKNEEYAKCAYVRDDNDEAFAVVVVNRAKEIVVLVGLVEVDLRD